MSPPQPDERHTDHDEVARRARKSDRPVGPLSAWGTPVTVTGFIVAALCIAWVIGQLATR